MPIGTFCKGFAFVVAVALTSIPAAVHAQLQTQVLELSANEFTHDCDLLNVTPGVRTVYVRLFFNIGSTAVRFRVVPGPNVTLSYLSETHMYPMTLGDSQSGISVCFGECLVGDAVVAAISYMSYGTGSNCGLLLLAPHPEAETVEILDCDGAPRAAWLLDINVNHNTPCGCSPLRIVSGTPHAFGCAALSLQASTWGAIKALYRN
jgi:hypothetical protein